MRATAACTAALGAVIFITVPAMAEEPIIYPNRGQNQDQIEKDKYECYGWAKGQSGFDPMAPPTATSPPPRQEAKQGGALPGAAKGALGGVVIGGIAGDAGKGAAIGAVSGGMIGGLRRHGQQSQYEAQKQQWERQQAAAYYQGRDLYNRAFTACLEGRGYTLK